MSKNKVQFQKGMSLPDFIAQYGTDQQCRVFVFKIRCPKGFRCPECGGANWGGELRGGKRGRGSTNKTPFVAAIETTEDGQPIRMKMHKVKGFQKKKIRNWSQQQLNKGSYVVTDGLNAFSGLDDAGFEHEAIVTGGVVKA